MGWVGRRGGIQRLFQNSPFQYLSAAIGTRQEQTRRYITHTTTNTQPAFGSVLIKDKTKFEGSKHVP